MRLTRFAVLLFVVAAFSCTREPDSGAELTYEILFPSDQTGDRTIVTHQVQQVIARRLEECGFRYARTKLAGDDSIAISLPGVNAATLVDCKVLLGTIGKLELYAAASEDVQERYNKDKIVPQDYRAWANTGKMMSEDYGHFGGDLILLQDKPVIEGKHIVSSKPDQSITNAGGGQWIVDFKLNSDGAKFFDEAAAVLFKQKPRGLIAIVLDGKILSKPIVQSESFGGYGQISGGFTEQSARNLSIILKSGILPAPVQLKSESFYDGKKK